MHIHEMDDSYVGRDNEVIKLNSLPFQSITNFLFVYHLKLLRSLLVALQHSLDSNFSEDITVFPQPLADLADLSTGDFDPFVLPSILVPPEVIEIDNLDLGGAVYEEVKTSNKKDELPQYHLSLFDHEVSFEILCHLRILNCTPSRLHQISQHQLVIVFDLQSVMSSTFLK
jgi:hypothetical protein